MLVTTTPIIEGKRIVKYYGIVSGETIIGANVFRDLFASIRDIVGGRSGAYEEVLRMAKDTALQEMQAQAAKALYATLAEKLCPAVTDSMTVAQVLAFIVIWIAVPLIFTLVASLLTKAMEAISLGWLNRWLGSGLGALKFLLLTSLVICVIEFIDSDNKLISATKKSESLLYYPMETFAGIFFPAAKNITQQYILDNKDATRRTQ